jgi:hypothetical protein
MLLQMTWFGSEVPFAAATFVPDAACAGALATVCEACVLGVSVAANAGAHKAAVSAAPIANKRTFIG